MGIVTDAVVKNITTHLDSGISQRKFRDGTTCPVDVSGFFNIHAALEGGASVSLSATAAAYGMPGFDISIYGEEGELQFDLERKIRVSGPSSRGRLEAIEVDGVTPEERLNKASIFSGSFLYFAPRLVSAIQTGESSSIRDAAVFSDALVNQGLLDAALASSSTGKTIQLREGYRSNVRY